MKKNVITRVYVIWSGGQFGPESIRPAEQWTKASVGNGFESGNVSNLPSDTDGNNK